MPTNHEFGSHDFIVTLNGRKNIIPWYISAVRHTLLLNEFTITITTPITSNIITYFAPDCSDV